jgi:curli biogenesis system outer membrane secretion channel CsgG
MKEQLLRIAQALDLGGIDEQKARGKLLELLGISTHTYKIGDNVKWRGMDLIVVEVGTNEVLIATSINSNDRNYNDWWVGTQYLTKAEQECGTPHYEL